jgi:hypothetical protein
VSEIELHASPSSEGSSRPWRFAAGESCRWVASLGPGRASGINAVYCHVGPGRWRLTAAPPGWLKLTLAQTLANGGNPYVMLIGTPATQQDQGSLPAVAEMLRFAREHERSYRDLTPLAPIALLWCPSGGESHLRAFRGWYAHLIAQHRLFLVISDTQLAREDAAETLGRHRLLIAPDVARLGDAARQAIDRFVEGGGTLLVEHDTAVGMACTGLSEPVTRRVLRGPCYFRVRAGERVRFPSLEKTTLIPCAGRYISPGEKAGDERLFGLIPPDLYGAPEQTVHETETDEPGLLFHSHGRGRVAVLPWTVGSLLHDTNPTPLDGLARDLMASLLPETPVAVNAPPWVELTAHRQRSAGEPERLIVHLVNHSGHDGGTTRWSDPLPVTDVELTLRPGFTPEHLRAARLGRELRLVPAGPGTWRVTLPQLTLFELLVLEARRPDQRTRQK